MEGGENSLTDQAAGLPDTEATNTAKAAESPKTDALGASDQVISAEAFRPTAIVAEELRNFTASPQQLSDIGFQKVVAFNPAATPVNARHSAPVPEHPYPRALARGRLGRTLGGSLHDSSMEDVQVLDTEGRLEKEEEDQLWERYKDMESVDDGNPFAPDSASGPPRAPPPFSSLPPSPGLVNYFPSDATRNSTSENEGNNENNIPPVDNFNLSERNEPPEPPEPQVNPTRSSFMSTAETVVNLPTSQSLAPTPRDPGAAEPPKEKKRARRGCCFYCCLLLFFLIGILIFIYLVALLYMKSCVEITGVKLVSANSSIIATSAYALTVKAFVTFSLTNKSKWNLDITIDAVRGPVTGNIDRLIVKPGEKKQVSMETVFAYNEGTDNGWNNLKSLMKFCNRIPSQGNDDKKLEPLDWTIRSAIVGGFIFPSFARTFPLEGECPIPGNAKIDLLDVIKK